MEAMQFETTTDRPSEWLNGVKCRVTSVAKKQRIWGWWWSMSLLVMEKRGGVESPPWDGPLVFSITNNNSSSFSAAITQPYIPLLLTGRGEKNRQPISCRVWPVWPFFPVMCIWRGSSYQNGYLHFRFDLSGKILRCFHTEHFRWPFPETEFWMW